MFNTPSYINNDYQRLTVDLYFKKNIKEDKCMTNINKQDDNKILNDIKKEFVSLENIYKNNIYIVYR